MQVGELVSTTHDIHKDPSLYINPTFKPTEKLLQTTKLQTKQSGFQQNHAYQDGKGWIPDPVLHGNIGDDLGTREGTEYRDRFNAAVPFHRETMFTRTRSLPRP